MQGYNTVSHVGTFAVIGKFLLAGLSKLRITTPRSLAIQNYKFQFLAIQQSKLERFTYSGKQLQIFAV